jgi:hypothetical protein
VSRRRSRVDIGQCFRWDKLSNDGSCGIPSELKETRAEDQLCCKWQLVIEGDFLFGIKDTRHSNFFFFFVIVLGNL